MGPPNGLSFAAGSGSTWIYWWSPVASANWFTCSCVMVTQSLWPRCCPTRPCTPSTPSTVVRAIALPFGVGTTVANSTTRSPTTEERVAADRCPRRPRRCERRDGDREPDTRLVLRPRRDFRHGRCAGAGGSSRGRGRRHGRRRWREGRSGRGGLARGGDPPDGRPG